MFNILDIAYLAIQKCGGDDSGTPGVPDLPFDEALVYFEANPEHLDYIKRLEIAVKSGKRESVERVVKSLLDVFNPEQVAAVTKYVIPAIIYNKANTDAVATNKNASLEDIYTQVRNYVDAEFSKEIGESEASREFIQSVREATINHEVGTHEDDISWVHEGTIEYDTPLKLDAIHTFIKRSIVHLDDPVADNILKFVHEATIDHTTGVVDNLSLKHAAQLTLLIRSYEGRHAVVDKTVSHTDGASNERTWNLGPNPRIDSRGGRKYEKLGHDRKPTNIKEGEWHYLFDSSEYDWSMERIHGHIDNPNIKEYCYPEIELEFTLDTSCISNLSVDNEGLVYFDYTKRDDNIKQIREGVANAMYKSYVDFDIEPLNASMQLLKLRGKYVHEFYRDEAQQWIEDQFTRADSPIRSFTLCGGASADPNATAAIKEDEGDLYQVVERNVVTDKELLENVKESILPGQVITPSLHDAPIKLTESDTDLILVLTSRSEGQTVDPINMVETVVLSHDSSAGELIWSGTGIVVNDSIQYKITINNTELEFTIAFSGVNTDSHAEFRILFPQELL